FYIQHIYTAHKLSERTTNLQLDSLAQNLELFISQTMQCFSTLFSLSYEKKVNTRVRYGKGFALQILVEKIIIILLAFIIHMRYCRSPNFTIYIKNIRGRGFWASNCLESVSGNFLWAYIKKRWRRPAMDDKYDDVDEDFRAILGNGYQLHAITLR
ncbi:hypothetical protein L9F63_011849, partial [Diploptera punctata]